jgi:hypothetical protein
MSELIDHGGWYELPAETLQNIVERAASGYRRVSKVLASDILVVQVSRLENYRICSPACRDRTDDGWRFARERLWHEICVEVDLALAASGKVTFPPPRSAAPDYPRCGSTAEDVTLVIAFHAARLAGDQRGFNTYARDHRVTAGAADEARIRGGTTEANTAHVRYLPAPEGTE